MARIVRAAASYGTSAGAHDGALANQLSLAAVKQACGRDALCAARQVVAASGGRIRLEQVAHPGTDTIRWAETLPSVSAVGVAPDGRRWIRIDRFGRKVVGEVTAAVLRAQADGAAVGLDLRGNVGGDFGRMLRAAALFTNNIDNALYLIDQYDRNPVSLRTNSAFAGLGAFPVLIGPGTASSAEVLAALLQRYADARLVGTGTAGKDHLTRVIAVDHDWRLLVPAERIEVPGVTLAGGLRPAPDRPPGRPLDARQDEPRDPPWEPAP